MQILLCSVWHSTQLVLISQYSKLCRIQRILKVVATNIHLEHKRHENETNQNDKNNNKTDNNVINSLPGA